MNHSTFHVAIERQKKIKIEIMVSLSILWVFLPSCEKNPADHSSDSNTRLITKFESWPACATKNCTETWSRLKILGMNAGTEMKQQCRCHTAKGERILVQSRGQFAFLRQGTKIQQMATEKVLMDYRGRLLRYYRSEGQLNAASTIVRAGRIGDQLLTIRGPEIIRSGWRTDALAGPLFAHFLWKSHHPIQGQERSFFAFSHRTGGYSKHNLKVIDVKQSGHAIVEVKTQDAPGVLSTIELDVDLSITTQRSRFGKMTIESNVIKEKPEKIIPDNLPDITSFMSIHTKGTMTHPNSVCLARYKIKNLPARITYRQLNAPAQVATSAEDGSIKIRVSTVKTSGPAKKNHVIPPGIKPFLEPTALAPSNDQRIKNIAEEQTRDTETTIDAALALRNWVASNIKSDMGMTFASALEVIHSGRGDCSEKSVLLVALARSVGIPARAVIGLVFNSRQFAGHMWCEVWVGKWVPLDPSFGPETVSAARIRLGVDLLKMGEQNVHNTALMEIMTTGATIIIEETSHWDEQGYCPEYN